MKLFKSFLLLTCSLLTISFSSNSAQVSQAQIEQFKRMPKAQQQALAKSMGVDINALVGTTAAPVAQTEQTPVYPRGTVFDQFGNPTVPEKTQPIAADEETGLKPFGYDVFANAPSTFTPSSDIAIPEGYIIGPGDRISFQVFGKENMELELEVNREGQIIFPTYGPYTVSGLSFIEMKTLLASKIKEKVIGVNVVIGMASLRSMRIFVLGDAYKPGPYTLSSLSSITHALFAAGGISDIGSLRNVQLKRTGKLVATFDLYDLLIKGDSSSDMLLQSGDVVFIAPVGKRVFVEGEVRRPAIYELIEGETFGDVIAMSGGLLPSAFAKATVVERYHQNNLKTILNVDLADAKQASQKVMAGDHVNISKVSGAFKQPVEVIGAVNRPGNHQWFEGQKISDIFPSVEAHLLKEADLNYSLIVRELDLARNVEVLQFQLAKAILNPNSEDNVQLHPRDKIIVFSNIENEIENTDEAVQEIKSSDINALKQDEQENNLAVDELNDFSRQKLLSPLILKLKRQGASGQPMQLIEVDGQVKFPGIYPLTKGNRVSHLVSAAGGITESAYLNRAEVTRSKISDIKATKQSINVQLGIALTGDANENIILKSKDRLNIHQIPSWSENHMVELKGEFVFPGKYTISRGETLADIIEKAGGLTEYAFANGSVFARVKLKQMETKNLIKVSEDLRLEMASKSISDEGIGVTYAESKELLDDLISATPIGRLVIDLNRIMNENDYDVLLENGDVLYVPTYTNSINVIGQVQITSSHMYDPILDAEDYIEQSGGVKKRADEDRTYIVSANGSIRMVSNNGWFSAADLSLQPGDTVVVPLDTDYTSNIDLWSQATQILYGSAIAVAAISAIL